MYVCMHIQALAHPFFSSEPKASSKEVIARRVQDYLAAKSKAAAEKATARDLDGMYMSNHICLCMSNL